MIKPQFNNRCVFASKLFENNKKFCSINLWSGEEELTPKEMGNVSPENYLSVASLAHVLSGKTIILSIHSLKTVSSFHA